MDASNPSGLFRAQAINHITNNLLGKVLVVPKAQISIVTGLLLLWLFVAGVWLFNANFARQVTVQGWLEPQTGSHHHFATLNQAVVAEIYVQSGDQVTIGQPLLKLKTERKNLHGQQFNQLIKQELIHTRGLLEAELSRVSYEQRQRAQYLTLQQEQLKSEDHKLAKVFSATRQQLDLAQKNQEKMHSLHQQGWISDIDLNTAKAQTLQLQTQQSSLERDQIQLQREYDSVTEQLSMLPSTSSQSKHQLKQQIAEVNQRIIQLDSTESEIIFAQSTGKVSDVFTYVGKHTNDKPLLTIVPNDSKFIALLPVPTHAAGFIEKGQSIAFRYDAYPHEKFGMYHGIVESVSDSILLPNEVSGAATHLTEPVYMVRAALDSQQVQAYGDKIQLKSGHTFAADIALGERTIAEWLFAPLFRLKGRL